MTNLKYNNMKHWFKARSSDKTSEMGIKH